MSYWNGPAEIRIPDHLISVPALNDCDTYYKDGTKTQIYYSPDLSYEKYREKYGELRSDGYWYWKDKDLLHLKSRGFFY